MIIDEQKRKALELLASGEHTKTKIAELVGVSRQAIYDWLGNKNFMAALDKRLQEIKTLGEKEFNAKLLIAIDEYWNLIYTTQDNRTKEKALAYWIDRSLGKTASQINLNATAKHENDNIKPEDLEAEFEKWEDEVDEDNDNENIQVHPMDTKDVD